MTLSVRLTRPYWPQNLHLSAKVRQVRRQVELIYVGLPNGRLLVSLSEGGDSGQEWFDIRAGLNGAGVQDIAPNIRQFSQEAFLVSTTGVFWMPEDQQPDSRVCRYPGRSDIIPGGDQPVKSRLLRAICDAIQFGPGGNVNNPWIDITGNLRSTQHTVFPGAWNGEGPLGRGPAVHPRFIQPGGRKTLDSHPSDLRKRR